MKILLSTDGSSHAQHAEEVIAGAPLNQPLDVRLVTVCPSGDLHTLTGIPEGIHEMVAECRNRSQRILDEASARVKTWAATVTSDLRDGHPAEEVVQAAKEWGADVIVLGARGLGAVSRFFLGSTSDRIAQHAPCAVLITRQSPAADSTNQVRRILLAYDGSPAAEAAADRLLSLPLTSAHTVLIRSVVEMAPWGSSSAVAARVYEQLEAQLKPKLDQLVQRFAVHGVLATPTLHVAHNTADDLIDAAQRQHADLILMGSVGKSNWQRLLLGSVTMRVLHHAPCSVWVEHLGSRVR